MSDFDAAKARTKYALPLWVDAFVRDTLDLSAAEIGAYNLMLFAMWTRESCDLPDDDRKLAQVCRVSPTMWRRTIRPTLERFFFVADGVWINTRLRREARKTEDFLTKQSDRKRGPVKKKSGFSEHSVTKKPSTKTENKTDKPLKNNNAVSTADMSTDASGDRPTQETKRPSISGGGGDARAMREPDPGPKVDRERLLVAMGADPSGISATGRFIGTLGDMAVAQAWIDDLGLTLPEIEAVITETMRSKAEPGPPQSFKYFNNAMRRFAGQRNQPTLTPIDGGQTTNATGAYNAEDRLQRIISAAAEGTSGKDWG